MSFDYPRNVPFQCQKCAACCGDTDKKARHILLLKMEAEQIAKATGKPIGKFALRIVGHAPYCYEMRKTLEKGQCVFLEGKRCTIYSLRPLICRFYPFELKTARNGRPAFHYTMECQGIGVGERLTKGYFKSLIQQLRMKHR